MMKNKIEWMHEVLSAYEGRLLRYTSRLVHEAAAREIVQEAFLRLWQAPVDDVREQVRNWLYTVCRNLAFDLRKKEARLRAIDENDENDLVAPDKPDEQAETGHSHRSIMKHVNRLPESHREVLRLKFQEDLSYKEISSITGHSISHVGVLLHEALLKLRTEIQVRPVTAMPSKRGGRND
jgi:RNA polymerase sigma factor (sigma-70 family)